MTSNCTGRWVFLLHHYGAGGDVIAMATSTTHSLTRLHTWSLLSIAKSKRARAAFNHGKI